MLFRSAGAQSTDSCATLAAKSDVLILCVTASPQVEDVIFRQDGVLTGLKRGAIVLDCTTAIPSSTLKVAQAVQDAGGRYLDTAMTRTSKEAEEGRLGLIVGGDEALFKEVEPFLHCFAESISYTGPTGNGHKLKLLHNFVSLGFAALLAEAAACAGRAGVPPKVFLDVLEKGAGDGVSRRRIGHEAAPEQRVSLGIIDPIEPSARNSQTLDVGRDRRQIIHVYRHRNSV